MFLSEKETKYLKLRGIIHLRENAMSADNQQGRVQLEPWYISGFVDGEGSFHIALYQDSGVRSGWRVIPEFHVSQRESSKHVLEEVKNFFQCGNLKPNHRTNPKDVTYVYVVRNREDLLHKIVPFFFQYPLRTEKSKDFLLFVEVMKRMENNDHITKEGVKEIINLAYQMNGQGRYRRKLHQV